MAAASLAACVRDLEKTLAAAKAASRPTGSGLGLWISRGLVEAHGGRLVATSILQQGTTFRFTLPLDAFEQLHA